MFAKRISATLAVAVAFSVFTGVPVIAEQTEPVETAQATAVTTTTGETSEPVITDTTPSTSETTFAVPAETSDVSVTEEPLPSAEATETSEAQASTGVPDTTEGTAPLTRQEMINPADHTFGTQGCTEYSTNEHRIYTMDDLVQALGAQNVSVTSPSDIKLLNNIIFTDQEHHDFHIYEGTYNIDFNGYRVEGVVILDIDGGNVTLSDTSAAKTGGIVSLEINDPDGGASGYCGAVYQENGILQIKSGRYAGAFSGIYGEGGTLIIDGGEICGIHSDEYPFSDGLDLAGGSNATIRGGFFHGDVTGLYAHVDSWGDTATPYLRLQISGGFFESLSDETDKSGLFLTGMEAPQEMNFSGILAPGYVLTPNVFTQGIRGSEWYVRSGKNVRIVTSSGGSIVQNGVENFVTRLYVKALQRSADPTGFTNWVTNLKSLNMNGAQVAYGFLFSQELINRNLSNKDYITLLYRVFFDREPDAGGLQYWLTSFDNGVSRKYVFAGFANSQEWKTLCGRYGIAPGSYTSDEARDQNIQVTMFVQRLYSLCLGRTGDATGINNWAAALIGGTGDGAHVAYSFFSSQEMINRNLSNDKYVEILYGVLLGRAPDATGKANWVSQLQSGKSRAEIFRGFANSQEFDGICKSYGITRGSV